MKTNQQNENRRLNIFIQVFGLLTILLGVSAILGWIFDIQQLASFDSSKIPMVISTAVLFVAFGFVIFFYQRIILNRIMFRVGAVISIIGIIIALLLLYLALIGIHPGAGHLGLGMSFAVDGLIVGQMSPVTAFCFVLVGLSFFIILTKPGQKKLIITSLIFAVLVFFISIVFLFSYLLGTPLLYEGSYIPPALTTSLAFLFLSVALLLISGLKVWSKEELSNALSARYTYTYVLVFIVLILSIMTAGYSYYKSYEKQFRLEIEQDLSTIATLKVNQIVQWRKERLGDAKILYKNAAFSRLINSLLKNQNDIEAKKGIQEWIDIVHSTYQYESISLHDLKGRELAASPIKKIHSHLFFPELLSEIQKSGEIIFKDFYRDENDLRIYLAIFIPIQSDNNLIGILDLRIDPEQYLYPLINKWPTPSKTAETLIVRREGKEAVFLNELKFQKNTALNFRRPLTELNLASTQAVLGKKNIMQGVDYRGVPVLAYVCPIPNSPWFLVARIDIAEVYAPLRERFWAIIILVVVLLTGSGASVGLVWRNQRSKFYKERHLSTESIRKLNRVYAVLSEINEAIVRIREPQELFEKACNIAIEKGGFQMAWIGKINSQTKKIDLVASKGVSDEYIKKIDLNFERDESLLGIAGRVHITGVHVISNDIQNDESILPLHKESVKNDSKSIAAFPLKVFGQVWGVFELYSNEIGFFDEEELKLLDELAMDIAFSIEFDSQDEERKHSEELLFNSEIRYRRLFESAKDGILILNAETGKIVDVNPFLLELLGYTKENFIEKEIWEIGFFKDIVANYDKFIDLQQKKYVRYEDLPLEAADGRKINVEFVSNVYLVDQHKVIQCNIRDITERKRAEEVLRESERLLRESQSIAHLGSYVWDLLTGFWSSSKILDDIFGIDEHYVRSLKGWASLLHPDWSVEMTKYVNEEVLGKHQKFNKEYKIIRKSDGKELWVHGLGELEFDSNNQPIKLIGTIIDISERKKAEINLIESEEKYRSFFENSMDAILLTSPDGRILSANPAACKMFGFSEEEFIELGRSGVVDTTDPRLTDLLSKRSLNKKVIGELTFIRKDGVRFSGEISSAVFKNPVGLENTSMIIRDITERKRAEEALNESEHLFHTLALASPVGIFKTNRDGYTTYVNPKWCQISGLAADDALGNGWLRAVHPDDREKLSKGWQESTKIQKESFSEYRFLHQDGTIAWVIGQAIPETNSVNQIIGYIGMITDITERKLVEEEISRMANIMEATPDLVGMVDPQGNVFYLNHGGRLMMEMSDAEDITKLKLSDFHSEEVVNRMMVEAFPAATKEGHWSGETKLLSRTGEEIPVLQVILCHRNAKNIVTHYSTIARDIRENKRAEEKVQKLSLAVEQSPVSVVITNKEGEIEYVNNKFYELTGYTLEEVKDKNPKFLKSGQHSKSFYDELWGTILSGKVWKGEMLNKKKNGEIYWESQSISPLVNNEGEITHFVAMKEDITDKMKMISELYEAKENAESANKLKDAFINNISHEIRTPLNGIVGLSSLIKEGYSQYMVEDDASLFTGIDDSAQRIIRTVDMILNFSRMQSGEFTVIPKQINLFEICELVIKQNSEAAEVKSLELLFDNRCNGTKTTGDEYTITQIVSILVENAIKYTKKGTVEIALLPGTDGSVILEIKDTGIGIAEEYLEHLFEPYRQEEMGYGRAYEGLGLGLALTKKYCDLNKAELMVTSKKGEGTTFSIGFKGASEPKIDQFKLTERIETVKPSISKREAKTAILIVEDDKFNQEFLKRVLDKKYTTHTAVSAEEAYEVLEKNEIDLILMDISIQGNKDGLELTKELKGTKKYSYIPVIAVTAHAGNEDQKNAVTAGCDDYLAKPFSMDQLFKKIGKFV